MRSYVSTTFILKIYLHGILYIFFDKLLEYSTTKVKGVINICVTLCCCDTMFGYCSKFLVKHKAYKMQFVTTPSIINVNVNLLQRCIKENFQHESF